MKRKRQCPICLKPYHSCEDCGFVFCCSPECPENEHNCEEDYETYSG